MRYLHEIVCKYDGKTKEGADRQAEKWFSFKKFKRCDSDFLANFGKGFSPVYKIGEKRSSVNPRLGLF